MKFLPNLSRYDDFIANMKTYPVIENGVLLYGSSFFTNWGFDRARKQLFEASGGALEVTNHGFGGATADELLYFYHELVTSCKPRLILWRGGPNDFFNGLDVHDAWQMSMRVFEWAKKDFPGVKIAILCAFEHPSCVRVEQRAFYKAYDALAREYAADNEGVYFVDINDFFHERAEDIGTFERFSDVFGPDGLHMTDEGYEKFTRYIAPKLMNLLNG